MALHYKVRSAIKEVGRYLRLHKNNFNDRFKANVQTYNSTNRYLTVLLFTYLPTFNSNYLLMNLVMPYSKQGHKILTERLLKLICAK